ESVIRRYVRYQPGLAVYDRSEMIRWQQELQSTVFFSSVDVRLASQAERGRSIQQVADQAAESAGAGDLDAVRSSSTDTQEDAAGDTADAPEDDTKQQTDARPEVQQRGLRYSQLMEQETLEVPVR